MNQFFSAWTISVPCNLHPGYSQHQTSQQKFCDSVRLGPKLFGTIFYVTWSLGVALSVHCKLYATCEHHKSWTYASITFVVAGGSTWWRTFMYQ